MRFERRLLLLLFALWAGLAAAVATNVAGPPRCDVGAEEDLACARGFETREYDGYRSFRWTDEQATVTLAAAGYGPPGVVELVLAAPRPPGVAPPAVALQLAGRSVGFAAPLAARRYRLLLPSTFPLGDRATLVVGSETISPPDDARALGVMVYEARIIPPAGARAPGPLLVLALFALGLSASLALTGGRAGWGARPGTQEKKKQTFGDSAVLACWPSALAGLATISFAAGLWALLPARVTPFLPGLALLVGTAALIAQQSRKSSAVEHKEEHRRQAPSPRSLLYTALLGGAALDATLVVGALPLGWIAPALLAQACLTAWAAGASILPPPADPPMHNARLEPQAVALSLRTLLFIALTVRLLAFAARLLAGHGASDPDTELFYSYGRATLDLGVPTVEYPSGALLLWALMALPASRELFALLLPLLNLLCDLAIVWGIWALGSAARATPGLTNSPATRFALFYALSPLLLPFWYGKYDPLPVALLIVGLAAFASGRYGWAGAALGFGGAIKWFPWLAAPFLAWWLLFNPPTAKFLNARLLARFLFACLFAIVITALPFALRDWANFLAPYTIQSARPLVGESLWFPLALLIDPGLFARLPAPWSGVAPAPIAPLVMVGVQVAALGALAIIQAVLPNDRRRALALAALAPMVFLLLNRVFSPQYLLVITACALAAGAIVLRARQQPILIAALALMQAANLLVWPNTVSYWLVASISMFVAGILIIIWLLPITAQGGS